MHSYDDQYNLVTNKYSSLNNHNVSRFAAIDYFQFDFNEVQLHNCWKLIHNVHSNSCYIPQSTNVARLENIIWRKWAKKKNDLKEISPEAVNWYKDCDITWLYGPLPDSYTTEDNFGHPLSSSCSATPIDIQQTSKESKSTASSIDSSSFNSACSESFSSLSSSSTLEDTDVCFESLNKEVYFLQESTSPKPILKKSSNGPINFVSYKEDDDEHINKSVSFADMVQIRQFY